MHNKVILLTHIKHTRYCTCSSAAAIMLVVSINPLSFIKDYTCSLVPGLSPFYFPLGRGQSLGTRLLCTLSLQGLISQRASFQVSYRPLNNHAVMCFVAVAR